jgi:hypothetical protein
MKKITYLITALMFNAVIKIHANHTETIIPNGLIFRIEINLSEKILSATEEKKFAPISGKNELSKTILCGAWCDYLWAQKAKNDLKEAGFKQLEIKSFFNNYEISLKDAFELLNNRNHAEEHKTQEISKEEIESLLQQIGEKMVYYRLQIGVYDGKNANAFLDLPTKYKIKITEFGTQSYICGKFFGYNEAKDMVKILNEEGLTDIIIIAFNGDNEQLPLERAQEIEQKFISDKLNELAKK